MEDEVSRSSPRCCRAESRAAASEPFAAVRGEGRAEGIHRCLYPSLAGALVTETVPASSRK